MLEGSTSTGNITQYSTGFLKLASGTTAQRPGTPTNGMIRYNSDIANAEAYVNGSWQTISTTNNALSTVLPGTIATRYYTTPVDATVTTTAFAANILYAIPLWYNPGTTFTKIGLEVTATAAASNTRLGIYDNTAGGPGNRILDAGTVSNTTTGLKEITISYTTDADWFWLVAVVQSGSPTFRAINAANGSSVLGRAATTDAAARRLQVAFTYAALPATFPTGAALNTANAPFLWVRL